MTLIIFGVKLLLGAMKASRQQASENRARVLRVAARRFREGAIAGVSVADVMHEAGLTHGGFYKILLRRLCQAPVDLARRSTASTATTRLVGHRTLLLD
jgi:TetR/AcrR family transcriptional regulator, transcriptional repressor for nem operon